MTSAIRSGFGAPGRGMRSTSMRDSGWSGSSRRSMTRASIVGRDVPEADVGAEGALAAACLAGGVGEDEPRRGVDVDRLARLVPHLERIGLSVLTRRGERQLDQVRKWADLDAPVYERSGFFDLRGVWVVLLLSEIDADVGEQRQLAVTDSNSCGDAAAVLIERRRSDAFDPRLYELFGSIPGSGQRNHLDVGELLLVRDPGDECGWVADVVLDGRLDRAEPGARAAEGRVDLVVVLVDVPLTVQLIRERLDGGV